MIKGFKDIIFDQIPIKRKGICSRGNPIDKGVWI